MTEDARLKATHHVLIAIGSVVPPERFPGPSRIRGQVIHVWSGSINLGTPIEVTRVAAQGEPPVGSDDWSDWNTIKNARYLDAHLEGSGDFHTLVRGGAVFLRTRPAGVRAAAGPAASSANLALGSSLVGFGCFPFALLGLVFSLMAFSKARKDRQPPPARAVVALLLSLVVIVIGILISAWMRTYKRDLDAASQQVANRLKGKRGSASLDKQTACDLLREQMIAGTFGNVGTNPKMTCRGLLRQNGDRATLEDVDAEFFEGRDHLAVCFARTARWFVTGVVAAGSECPAISVPPSQSREEKAQLEAEKSTRKQLEGIYDRAEIDTFTSGLRSIRSTLQSERRHASACDNLDIREFVPSSNSDSAHLKPPAVDVAFLARDAGAKDDWPFLTADAIRDALTDEQPAYRATKIAAMRREGGPYLVLYDSNQRALPEVVKKKGVLSDEYSYLAGSFDGWLIVADLRSGKAVCETKFAFQNTIGVKYKERGLSLEETRVREAVMDDLKEQFRNEATRAIRELSQGKLRLGYKLLE